MSVDVDRAIVKCSDAVDDPAHSIMPSCSLPAPDAANEKSSHYAGFTEYSENNAIIDFLTEMNVALMIA